ncbi:MAG: helix-hairpin-helix domain-containing protein [Nitrospiraceae bacterium]
MIRSLLIKLAMLGATLCTILWIGSSVPPKGPGSAQRTATIDRTVQPFPAAAAMPESAPEPVVQASPVPLPVMTEESTASVQTGGASVVRIDVNRATLSELTGLPGIGPTLAQRVIDYRRANGQFKKVDDLLLVKGIGRKKLERVRALVTIHHAPESSRHKGVS